MENSKLKAQEELNRCLKFLRSYAHYGYKRRFVLIMVSKMMHIEIRDGNFNFNKRGG